MIGFNKFLLKNWNSSFFRHFPWRNNPTTYKILIAEFMLQRTKAEQVEPVYKKFICQYPSIKKLSRAKSKTIAKLTSSLGFYWRAKNFLYASKYIVNNFAGRFPKTRKELLTIPGIGDYVAGAIMAVCYNNAEYVIDSNIARFINRYYGFRLSGEIRRKKIIIDKSRELFRIHDQRKYLFALLDFTALICKPIKPRCYDCPLKKQCKFFRDSFKSAD